MTVFAVKEERWRVHASSVFDIKMREKEKKLKDENGIGEERLAKIRISEL